MKRTIKASLGLAIGVTALMAASQAHAAEISLRPVAGRYQESSEKYVGGGFAAKAYANGDGSYTLSKLATTPTDAYAALVVEGVNGETLGSFDSFGFAVAGDPIGGGAPRMNLFWDNDSDGMWDGYAMVGGSSVATGNQIYVSFDGIVSGVYPVVGDPATADSQIVSLSVLVDEQGTWVISDVTLA